MEGGRCGRSKVEDVEIRGGDERVWRERYGGEDLEE